MARKPRGRTQQPEPHAEAPKTAGRPTLYSDELADEICQRLEDGESLRAICADPGMPGLRTVLRWAGEREDFGSKYAHAREAQAEVMDDMILTAARKADANPAGARVMIEAYKWRAAKLAPKRYGEKVALVGGGEGDAPLTFARIERVIVDPKN